MTFYAVMFGDMCDSELVFTTTYGWQALYAIEALANVAPEHQVRLRVFTTEAPQSVRVLTVHRGRWRVHGAIADQEVA